MLSVILDLQRTNPRALHPVEFVTWRGILTVVICTPFNRRESWELAVSKFKVDLSL